MALGFLLIQSYFFSSFETPWLHLDLLAIFVFYVGLEHHTFSAMAKIVLLSFLAELWSSVPSGFYLTSHLLMMVVGNRLADWLEMQRRVSQLLLFGFLLSVKETLFALTLSAMGLPFVFDDFVQVRLPGMLTTLMVALPLMELLSHFDGRFERFAVSKRHGPPMPSSLF